MIKLTITPALSSVERIQEAADCFFAISDALHRRLVAGGFDEGHLNPSIEVYGILTDEYGLRARASILRNDANFHIVENASKDQQSLLSALKKATLALEKINNIRELRSIVVSISTLCVAISPGKGGVVDFLLSQLQSDLSNY
jgi:hypothetical protein